MKYSIYPLSVFLIILFYFNLKGQPITTGTLLNEMVNLKRLAEMPEHPYKYIQFSSYDRRSTNVSEPGWFSNSDGFGDEPIPGFEKVLKAPDENGIGEYLMCEINQAGTILRLMTAGINGKISLILDNNEVPVYEGPARDFFWNLPDKLLSDDNGLRFTDIFRQRDATYFPVPFAKSCRIEWIGDIRKAHFYHIGIRVYEPGCEVETFNPKAIPEYLAQIEKIKRTWDNPDHEWEQHTEKDYQFEQKIENGSHKKLIQVDGSQAIEYLSLKLTGSDRDKILRQNIINIWFDGSPVPQVQSPVGDFFGAAPGINPYRSLPFSVYTDSTMVCRFFMPFRDSARIEIENNSGETIMVKGEIRVAGYKWEPGKSMYFGARWRINHQLTASDTNSTDIPYLLAFGKGRVVGAAAFIYNPSNAPASHGNWWGEGDEKIYIDQDTFPSLFGTGSEDYFNYSWSSPDIFSFPYSGQPRNDGPGNRGFVSNYRWHILDDIPFKDRLAFYMELLHHGEVPDFSYGRTVYLYALPGMLDDHVPISGSDIREQTLTKWEPIAYKGSDGYSFYNAEDLILLQANIYIEEGALWANGKILMWSPLCKGDKIRFSLPDNNESDMSKIIITLAHQPDGGEISVYVNGEPTEFNKKKVINLYESYHHVLRNHSSTSLTLKKGKNEVVLEYVGETKNKKIGIDFLWIRE